MRYRIPKKKLYGKVLSYKRACKLYGESKVKRLFQLAKESRIDSVVVMGDNGDEFYHGIPEYVVSRYVKTSGKTVDERFAISSKEWHRRFHGESKGEK